MSRVHFTADHHFGHEGIIGMCNRPFTSAEEMDETLITYWNAVVRPNDKVWHLGDFAHRADPKRMRVVFDRLNGTKHLVIGNHDKQATQQLPWASQQQMAVLCVDGVRSVLCHYGMRVWPEQRRGAIQLYGHSHGRLPGTSLSIDVGVDCWNYMPVNLKQILDRIKELPEADPEGDPEPAGEEEQ
jgi:calcineurin-like phosphoesterase family protein